VRGKLAKEMARQVGDLKMRDGVDFGLKSKKKAGTARVCEKEGTRPGSGGWRAFQRDDRTRGRNNLEGCGKNEHKRGKKRRLSGNPGDVRVQTKHQRTKRRQMVKRE